MPKVPTSSTSKIRGWIKDYPELKTDGKKLFCVLCEKTIGSERKSQVDAHVKTTTHTQMKERQKLKKMPVQPMLTEMLACSASMDRREEFMRELCYAMVASDIPFNKLNATPLRDFLNKYTDFKIPDESTLRKNYLSKNFDLTIQEIRKKLSDHYLYIMVDETTDSRGKYICGLIVGILHPDLEPTPYLISLKELPKTNHDTVSRFINDSLCNFFVETSYQDRIILMLSDAAPYMIKTGSVLKVFYPKMIHTTCMAHGLNRVAEKVREIFPNVNKLINFSKKIVLKSPARVVLYRDIMDCALPPEVVITRWGTWLEAALFYAENFIKYKEVIVNLEDDSQSVSKVKELINKNSVSSDLAFIRTHFSIISKSIVRLEERYLPLNSQIGIIEKINEHLKEIKNEKGVVVYKKFLNVLDKNPGYTTLKLYDDVLQGNDVLQGSLVDLDPMVLSCFKLCPATSVDIERVFSQLKNILSDRRQSFTENNFEKYMVVNFNKLL